MTSETTIVLRYIFPARLPTQSHANILRSDEETPAWLRDANPGGWHPIEWNELIEGTLGPWAMVVDDHRVVSIAHTPKPTTEAESECGVWTDPSARGKGYATATAIAWASISQSVGRSLIYSTTEDNLSSQRVAERLGLRLVSRDEKPRSTGGSSLHPLCSIYEEGN